MIFFQLLNNICLIFLVGVERNLSLLELYFLFPGGLSQMDVFWLLARGGAPDISSALHALQLSGLGPLRRIG